MTSQSSASRALVCLLLAIMAPVAVAQETPQPDQDAETALREQSVYIPYTKLREVFEKEGRGVFLPYERFQALWKAARDNETRVTDDRPPVGALISEVSNEATVEEDVVRVKATAKIEVLAEGWNEVPLRLGDAAILSATIGGETARIIYDNNGGYKLLVKKDEGDQPVEIDLVLEYSKAYTKAPGQNSVSFQAPQAPVNRWNIRIPEAGVKVNIHPLLAATEASDDEKTEQQADETIVLAFVGAAPSVRIDWTPKAEGAAGLEALATVQAEQEVTVDEGVLRTRTRLAYKISRAELAQLKIEVPADQKVVNVYDPNVRKWDVEAAGELQTVTVDLFEPTRGSQNITIELEKFSDDVAKQEIGVPVVKALNVGRQQGVVVVGLAGGLRAEVARRTGLLQLDTAELPAKVRRRSWAFSYRYSTLPFDLALTIEKVLPRITVEELVTAQIEPEKQSVALLAIYNVERAGIFQLELNVPAGYDLRQVRGYAINDAQAAAVDAYHQEGDDQTRLLVNLSRKAMGKVGLLVQLQKRLDDANLLSPTGTASEIPLEMPRVASGNIEHSSGKLVVFGAESLRINPGKSDGLRGVSLSEAPQHVFLQGDGQGQRKVLAFAFTRDPASLTLSVERRKPYVTARQLLVARIESGVVKYEATLFYDIRFSGVKSLRLDVPSDLASEIRVVTASTEKDTIDPQPDDVSEGHTAWSLTGDNELLGNTNVVLAWDEKMKDLEVGKGIDLAMPVLRPRDVDRDWGQIVATKSETLDVRPAGQPVGIRPIDPQQDLMPGANVKDAAQAFEFHEDWSLTLTATRYKLETVKRTSIERAVLRMVATRSDEISVQALYRMKSKRQRMAILLPGTIKLDNEPLRINGKIVGLERGDKAGEYSVPLVGLDPERPFLMELRYTAAGGPAELSFPVFPSEPAVQKVYLCAYLPEEWALLGSGGPWAAEPNWQSASFNGTPRTWRNDAELITWVSEGVSISSNPGQSFPTDGRLYVYSTLRPDAPSNGGALRLSTFSRKGLLSLVFMGVVLLGVPFVTRPVSQKFIVLAVLVIVLILAGVFLPTFTMQIMNQYLVYAIITVVALWLVAYLAWIRPQQLAMAASSAPTRWPTVTPPVSPPPSEEATEEESTEGGESNE